MAIVVRPANLDSDRGLLIDALFRFLTPLSDGHRFDWLYRQNPHGPARVWIAVDAESEAVVGASAVFPRRLYLAGSVERGCVLGDFCVHPHYRSLGPALQLQRACLAEVDSGALALAYDFPSAGMMALYKRLGVKPYLKMVRFAKLLRADRKIAEKVKLRPVARGLSAASNALLSLQARGVRQKNGWVTSLHEGACGKEFSVLAREVSACHEVCVERSAEYLNWRYLAHPLQSHQILAARREGRLAGYAVFTQAGEDARLVDLFGLPETEMLRSLVRNAVALLRERGAATVSAPLLATHAWVAPLESAGFRPRESCPVVVYPPARPAAAHEVASGRQWFLMDGDRDS